MSEDRLKALSEQWLESADDAESEGRKAVAYMREKLWTRASTLRKCAKQLSDASPQCVIGVYCSRHGFVHGAESEELRDGIEAAIVAATAVGKKSVPLSSLRTLLDETDARDSLAYLETLSASSERSTNGPRLEGMQ